MVSSTFQYFPAVVVLHSRDLVNWDPIGHVVTRDSQLDLTGIPDSYGVCAPDVSFYRGKFWVVVPYRHGRPRCTNYLYVADRPEGPYGEPVMLNHHFIDPSVFNDDDGQRYLVFGGGWVHQLADDGSGLVGQARQVWPGTGGRAPEGPHVLKRNGWYYLLLAEDGTFFGHKSTLARSRSIWGPYEPCPDNPVLSQPDPKAVIQRAGHGKFVDDPDGNWWMLHLGGRPLTSEGYCPLGRETFLERVEWSEDGWPVIGNDGVPEEIVDVLGAGGAQEPENHRVIADDFSGKSLDPSWEWVRNPLEGGFELTREGLKIRCLPYSFGDYQRALILTRRWEHLDFSTTMKLSFEPQSPGDETGCVLYLDTHALLLLSVRNGVGQDTGQRFDTRRLGENQERDGLFLQIDRCLDSRYDALFQTPLQLHEPLWLQMTLHGQSQQFTFAYSFDGNHYVDTGIEHPADGLYPPLPDGRHCFTAPRTGIYARGVYGTPHGSATFHHFKYAPGHASAR